MPVSNTYEPIATTTLISAVPSVTFGSIPQTYTDLVLIYNGTSGITNLPIRFNSDTGSNYSYIRTFGDGSTAYSDREPGLSYGVYAIGSSERTLATISINNYFNTTTFKTLLGRGNYTGSGYVSMFASLWRSTAAITSITLYGNTNFSTNFSVGSTFTLYGIKAA
jgi:hypothetical protein